MLKYRLFTLSLLLLATHTFAQSPYTLRWKQEVPYLLAGAGSISLGAYLHSVSPLITPEELATLEEDDILWFDRSAIGNYSVRADHISDGILYTSHLSPFLFLMGKRSRSQFGKIMAMYGEAASINLGLTLMTKSIFRRPRPFVFNDQVLTETKLKPGARVSFVSGHTSATALNTFFAAKVFADHYPHSKLKPWVWGAAAVIPAVTGYLRVKAGKHYPTDVIARYSMGAVIGILVPHLHRNRVFKQHGIRFHAGYRQIGLSWQFQSGPRTVY